MDFLELKSGLDINSFWHKAKLTLIDTLLSRVSLKDVSILNVGAGDGSDLKIINKYGKITVIDTNEQAIEHIPENLCVLKKYCNAEDISFPENSFDIVVAFDVLEHIENDNKAIAEFRRILKVDGYLIITAPAHNWMFSTYDQILGHFRRYSGKELKLKLMNFRQIYFSYWNFFLLIPMILERFRNNKNYKIKKFNRITNFIGYMILMFENYLMRYGIKFPTGGTICAIYKKST